jgi:hypothetical protein
MHVCLIFSRQPNLGARRDAYVSTSLLAGPRSPVVLHTQQIALTGTLNNPQQLFHRSDLLPLLLNKPREEIVARVIGRAYAVSATAGKALS